MSHSVAKQASRIRIIDSGREAENAQAPTRGGEYAKRRKLRRLDLSTLNGTLRESARVYRELASGVISLLEAETRSRVLRRHSEILTAIEQRDQVAEIQRQLEALRAPSGMQTSALGLILDDRPQTEIPNPLIGEAVT